MITQADIAPTSAPLEIDCQHQVHRIVEFIQHSQARLNVLHGRPNSGKTALIRQRVIPALRAMKDAGETWYGDCAPDFPDIVEGATGEDGEPQCARFEALTHRKSIIFIDTFGNIFDGPREDRRAVLNELFNKLQQPDAQAKVVLITDSKHLTSIYGLGVYDPRIVDAVFDIGSVSLTDALLQLAAANPHESPRYSSAVLEELEKDGESLDSDGVGVTFDLINILDEVFRSNTGLVENVEQYKNAGRLTGVLRTHLDEMLRQTAHGDENAEAIARGVLERVAEAHAQGVPFAGDDLLARLAVSHEGLNATLQLLLAQKVLREVAAGSYLPVPLQLSTILEQDLAEQKQAQERIANMLDEAMRSWSIVGNLLPRRRFGEIHRERRKLVLSNEHTRFMLYNSLRYADAELEDADYYWLRRIANRSEGADVLLASLFSDNAEVRMRAARLLRRYPEAEVRTRLHAVALTDPDERVRAQAVTSLEPMKTDVLMHELLHVVKEEKSNYRLHAIETLKLFKDPRVTLALSDVVKKKTSEPPVRKNAIGVLGAMNTPEAVDSLLEIALGEDEHDRREANAALARASSPAIMHRILPRLEKPTGITRARIISAALTTVLVFIAAFVQPMFWAIMRPFSSASAILLGIVGLAAFGAARVLTRIRRGEVSRASVRGVLGIAMFVFSVLTIGFWLHGLPQALIGQWKRAIRLTIVGLIALFFILLFDSARSLPGWTGVLGSVYIMGSILVFFGSYLLGLFALLFGSFVHRSGLALKDRKDDVCRTLMGNPACARAAFDGLDTTETAERRRIRRLVTRFGSSAPSDVLAELLESGSSVKRRFAKRALIQSKSDAAVVMLERLWQQGSRPLRGRIESVLCRQPTNRSIETLGTLRKEVHLLKRARFQLAQWHYRTALWPRSVRVGLLIVFPLAAAAVYHGYQVLRNPTWGLIITLSSDSDLFNLFGSAQAEQAMITAAVVAGEHYPDDVGEHLLRLFKGRKHTHNPRVHAAFARGLLIIDSIYTVRNEPGRLQSRDELVQQAGFFGNLIGDFSPDVSQASIEVLQAMANSRDTAVARTGTTLLQRFVFNPGRVTSDTARVRVAQANVISALGGLRAGRAFTALRAVRDTTGSVHGPEVRLQLARVAERAYANLIERQTNLRFANLTERERVAEMEGLVRWAKRLLGYYQAMDPKPTRLIDDLTRWINEVGTCDQNADLVCDQLDDALAAIKQDPDAESGYRQILDYYAGTLDYGKAFDRFATLKREYPNSVWPYKLLAEITHEHLVGTAQEFQISFDEMTELRRLDAFNRLSEYDRRRFLADFAEIALSAGKYEDLQRLAAEAVQGYNDDGYKLNMAIFLYAGAVMQGDRANAEARLGELEKLVRSLPKEGFYNNWVYPGTRKFFERSDLAPDVKAGLLALCLEGLWYSQPEAAAVIDRNRKALAQLN